MTGYAWDWQYAWSLMPTLLSGLKVTIIATLFGSMLAFTLGMVWTLIRVASIPGLSAAVSFFVYFLRGTPFLVQLFFLFYVLPGWGFTLPALTTGIVAIGFFHSAQVSEIYRAGIEDIPTGQWEAALTIGLPIHRVWMGVILPQALRSVLPVLGNVTISMFKETSVLSTITVLELLAQAMNAGFMSYRFVEPLTMAGALYFVVSYGAARLLRIREAA